MPLRLRYSVYSVLFSIWCDKPTAVARVDGIEWSTSYTLRCVRLICECFRFNWANERMKNCITGLNHTCARHLLRKHIPKPSDWHTPSHQFIFISLRSCHLKLFNGYFCGGKLLRFPRNVGSTEWHCESTEFEVVALEKVNWKSVFIAWTPSSSSSQCHSVKTQFVWRRRCFF